MAITMILRVLPGPLADSQLVGHAELVATGESVPFRGMAELIALARLGAADARDAGGDGRDAETLTLPTRDEAHAGRTPAEDRR